MAKPRLTIGMATYDDFHGVYFTLQALGIYHRDAVRDCEIIVVDNHPGSSHSRELVGYIRSISGKWNREARYIPMPGTPSTSQPRNRIFAEAAADAVLVTDCHVLLHPLALARTIEFFECNYSEGLYNGPMVYDWLDQQETGWADEWRGGMWGTWHHDPRGDDEDGEPFDVWACGLGCFAARKAAWQNVGGFPAEYRSFGGEEGVVHELFRAAGRPVQCLPWLKWTHRFGNPDGARYPRPVSDIVRNYVIGLQRVGLPLDRLRQHFVGENRISAETFDAIVADPVNFRAAARVSKIDGKAAEPAKSGETLEQLFAEVASTKRDLDQVAQVIRQLASPFERVAALVKRGEWEPILAAARPRELRVWQMEPERWKRRTHDAVERDQIDDGRLSTYSTIDGPGADSLAADVPPCDLLVIDTIHTGERLYQELMRHAPQVSRWILVRGSRYHWDKPEGDVGTGMGDGFARFRAQFPEWRRTIVDDRQYGFSVLSRDPADPDIDAGPGTELHDMLGEIGITPQKDCACLAMMRNMNRLGVVGCRQHRENLAGMLRANASTYRWTKVLSAAGRAFLNKLAWSIYLGDVYGSLVDLAIERAEKKANNGKAVAA